MGTGGPHALGFTEVLDDGDFTGIDGMEAHGDGDKREGEHEEGEDPAADPFVLPVCTDGGSKYADGAQYDDKAADKRDSHILL